MYLLQRVREAENETMEYETIEIVGSDIEMWRHREVSGKGSKNGTTKIETRLL